ncbi:heterogeneous nuclear ribonucleoprotein A1/A3 protein [Dioscorea alata]|uniref:Heterogeneous nuclear ribonucleoprotein A1/A3 protein n=1 Tax=Dioscorea alata TaxID=55571 RepID=A0ACB7UIV2_DIOAL|nr:heterogeneous nuclear ribonucleoprotein A1/A3 protein [Dioscorea alata]
MASRSRRGDSRNGERDGASPGKIFVGGLHKGADDRLFREHFEKYGTIDDSVIMRDKHTRQPRGFGFITYADPSVVDKVIEDTHVILGKQVEIKRTIPRGSAKDFKTKKIFVGGIPSSVTDDEFKNFFSKYGKVLEHQIITDHSTNRSRGFGFIVFDSEQVVDDLLAKGNMIDLAGSQVEIKKAEPKKASNPPSSAYGSNFRARSFGDGDGDGDGDGAGGFGSSYSGFGSSGFGPAPYRGLGGYGSRLGGYGGGGGGYGPDAGEFGGGYGGFDSHLGVYRGDSSLNYSSRIGSFGGGFPGGYGGSGLGGGYMRGEAFDGYGNTSYGSGYGYGSGAGYGSGGMYGAARGGYGGPGRYHPYAR